MTQYIITIYYYFNNISYDDSRCCLSHVDFYFPELEKDWVPLYYSGCTATSIHRRCPTTERHGGFDLLRFRPGPVHPSLGDLVVPGSPRSTISIPNLARTPDRHSPLQLRTPELKQSASLSLPVAWITGTRHRAPQKHGRKGFLLKCRADCAISAIPVPSCNSIL